MCISIIGGLLSEGCSGGSGHDIDIISGNRYEGDWYDDKMHGQGVLTYVLGDYHDGGFEHDHRSGKGSYVYTNGCAYYGSWKEYIPCDPNAYYTKPDGSRFENEQAAHDYMAALTNVESKSMGIEGQETAFVATDHSDDGFVSRLFKNNILFVSSLLPASSFMCAYLHGVIINVLILSSSSFSQANAAALQTLLCSANVTKVVDF